MEIEPMKKQNDMVTHFKMVYRTVVTGEFEKCLNHV